MPLCKFLHFFLLISISFIQNLNCAQQAFTVVGLFHDDNYQSEMAFRYALERFNMFSKDIKFKSKVVTVSKSDVYNINKLVCELVSTGNGIVGIFGPESNAISPMVRSIAANLEIPHLSTNFMPKTVYTPQTSLNVYPDFNLLSLGIAALVRDMEWKSFVLIYRDNEGLIKLNEVLEIATIKSSPVAVRQLGDTKDHRTLLKQIKQSNEFNIILDCKNDEIIDILLQCTEVGLMEYYYNYLLISMDSHMLDYSVLQTNANITMLRMVDGNNSLVHNAVRDWEMGELHRNNKFVTLDPRTVTLEAALMHDAVNLFTAAFRELHLTERIISRPMDCYGNEKWEPGFRIATYMKVRPHLNGLASTIKFNEYGKRTEFTLEIVENYEDQLELIATWTPSKPDELFFTRDETEQSKQMVTSLQKTLVMVSSRIGRPYLDWKTPKEGEVLEGNARFEGYSLDLIEALSKKVNFTYKFFITENNNYGKYSKKTKTWNGLIGDLLSRKAHLAICDLTITRARREVVDFSLPFMSLGISILYSKNKPPEKNIYAFLDPLDTSVWLYMLASYTCVAFVIYLIARMAPSDWENPHPCDQRPEELENAWTIKNSFWLILGSSLNAGCDIVPKGLSTRMCVSMWWFFIMIINQSYTANLAAFLTMEKSTPTITGADSLAKQTRIKYGLVDGGSTQTFFKESNFSTYARMYTTMKAARPKVFESSNAEGVKRVLTTKNQGYAFLMESSQIDYEIERNCNLRQVGSLLDSKGYGIAMPVNSQYRTAINRAVLDLQEKGALALLKKKWWIEMHGGGSCDHAATTKSAELNLAKFGGVFLVLGVGICIAFVLCIGEFLWNVHLVAVEEKLSHKDALKKEFLFAAKVWVTKKRVSSNNKSETSDKISSRENLQIRAEKGAK